MKIEEEDRLLTMILSEDNSVSRLGFAIACTLSDTEWSSLIKKFKHKVHTDIRDNRIPKI